MKTVPRSRRCACETGKISKVSHSLGADSTCKSLCRCFSCGPDTPRLPPGAGKDSVAAWPNKAYPRHRYGKKRRHKAVYSVAREEKKRKEYEGG